MSPPSLSHRPHRSPPATASNTINATALADTHLLTLTGTAAVTVSLTAGDLAAGSYTGNITVTGGSGTNVITTGSGNDIINGGAGAIRSTAAVAATPLIIPVALRYGQTYPTLQPIPATLPATPIVRSKICAAAALATCDRQ